MSKARLLGRLGRLLRGLVAAIVLGLLVETWLLSGWLASIEVESGSMAPALLGPHLDVVCSRCKLSFSIDAQNPPPRSLAICPNCYQSHDMESLPEQPGDRVLVDRAALAWRNPRRWEPVVFRCPENPRRLCVKRVVGLPGEKVAVLWGDVWIDGQVARKPLDVLRKLAVLVYDDRFRDSKSGAAGRFKPAGLGGWRRDGDSYKHDVGENELAASAINYLVYRHVDLSPGVMQPLSAPILDSSPYNQGESRQLVAVFDVLLRGRLRVSGSGTIALESTDGTLTFRAEIAIPSGLGTLFRDEARIAGFRIEPARLNQSMDIEWAMYDEQVVLSVDGEIICQHSFERHVRKRPTGNKPLSILAQGATIAVSDVQVFRDVDYGDSRDGGGFYELAADEYYVLGDNTSISDDSRTWDKPGLAAGAIVGRPARVWPY